MQPHSIESGRLARQPQLRAADLTHEEGTLNSESQSGLPMKARRERRRAQCGVDSEVS